MGELRRIGFLADTHSNKADGSDLPDDVLTALKGVDLIVHLGDIGRKGILDRLAAVAPVMVPSGDGKGYVDHTAVGSGAAPVKVVEGGGRKVGLVFNLSQPDKKIAVGENGVPAFPEGPVGPLLKRRVKEEQVDVVAFGGTHVGWSGTHDGVLFVNPGSPTLSEVPTVAVLDLGGPAPSAEVIRLAR